MENQEPAVPQIPQNELQAKLEITRLEDGSLSIKAEGAPNHVAAQMIVQQCGLVFQTAKQQLPSDQFRDFMYGALGMVASIAMQEMGRVSAKKLIEDFARDTAAIPDKAPTLN